MSSADTFRDWLVPDKLSKKSADEGISCTVGVHEEFLRQLVYGIGGHLALHCNNRRIGTLRKDDDPGTSSRGLWLGSSFQSDCGDVATISHGISVDGSLRFVRKKEVCVRHDGAQLILEELDDEGSGEVEAVDLVVCHGMLGDCEHGVQRNSEEEAGRVVNLVQSVLKTE